VILEHMSGAGNGAEWVENRVERSGAERGKKTMERERSAEWEVSERKRSEERAEWAAHSPLHLTFH